jgi:hypothetical protein
VLGMCEKTSGTSRRPEGSGARRRLNHSAVRVICELPSGDWRASFFCQVICDSASKDCGAERS